MFASTTATTTCAACAIPRSTAELVPLDDHGVPMPAAAMDDMDASSWLCRTCLAADASRPAEPRALLPVLDAAHDVDRHFTFEPRLVERTRLIHGFATAAQARAFLVGYWAGRLT
jgi:hypothetical protein